MDDSPQTPVSDRPLTTLLLVGATAHHRITYRQYLAADAHQTYQFLEAATLAEGMAAWHTQHPDGVVIDLDLPDGDGLDLLKTMGTELSQFPLPALVIAPTEADPRGTAAMDLGAAGALGQEQVTVAVLQLWGRQLQYRPAPPQDHFRIIFENMFQFIGLLSPDGTVLEANQTALNVGGLTREEVVGRPFWEASWWRISSDTQAQLQQAIAKAAQGRFVRYEVEVWGANQTVIPIDFSLQPLRDASGRITLLIPEGRDLRRTKQLQAEQQHALQLLQASERRYASLAAAVPVGLFRTDCTGRCTYLNHYYGQITGLTLADIQQNGWLSSIYPDDRPSVLALWRDCLQHHRSVQLEFRCQLATGVIKWLYGQMLPERDAQGQVVGCIGSITDISDRKRAEATLQQVVAGTAAVTGEDFFQALVRHLVEALNIRYAVITQLCSDQVQTLAFWAHQAAQPNVTYSLKHTPCQQVFTYGEFYCPTALQQHFPQSPNLVELSADSYLGVVLNDHDGQAIGHLFVMDVCPLSDGRAEIFPVLRVFAARAAAELQRQRALDALCELNRTLESKATERATALQASELRFQRVFTSNVVGMMFTDFSGVITDANDRFLEIIGYSRADLEGNRLNWFDLTPPEHGANDRRAMEHLRQHSVIAPWEKEYYHREGHRVAVLIGVAMLTADSDRCVCVVVDICDRKRAEAQLQRTNVKLRRATRLKDEFLANMSHELRTPLNAVLGMCEGLQDGVYGPVSDQQLIALRTIEHSGNHLLALINDILDLAKIESGHMDLRCTTVDVGHLVRSSLTFIEPQAFKKHLQLHTQISPTLPLVHVDERRMRQVLINLLNNAVKFTPVGGKVTLTAAHLPPQPGSETAYLRLAINDTGIGIAPEHLPRLFQPFTQIDGALNRQYEGTGLGLALVRRIIEQHGGQVNVHSEVNVGSCFTVDLPCATPLTSPLETDGPPLAQKPKTRPPQILLAANQDAHSATLSGYLNAKGYPVCVVHEGSQVLPQAEANPPDLLLLAMPMAGLGSLDIIGRLRQHPRLSELRVIVLMAPDVADTSDCCRAAGADDALRQPVRLQQLMAHIQRQLSRRGADGD